VNDKGFMGCAQGGSNGTDDGEGLGGGDNFVLFGPFFEIVAEGTAGNPLDGQIGLAGGGQAYAVDPDNVGMVELGYDLGFTAKAFDEFGFLGQGVQEDFEGDGAV
jgi:hypothetical protein